MSKPTSKSLVSLSNLRAVDVKLAGDPPICSSQLDRLISRANQQYELIKQGERDGALRAIFLGLLFWQIKNEAGHGSFMELATQRMPLVPRRTRNEYMRLALTFVERSRVALPERFEIPDAQLALAGLDDDDTQREIVGKALTFIGEHSIHELMIKHGIRAVGLKKDLSGEAEREETEAELPPDEVIRRRREMIFGATAEHLAGLRKTLTNAEELTLLDNTQRDMIKRELAELNAALDAITTAS